MTYHCTVGDQANQRIGRQQAQADYQCLLQRLELILIDTGVNNIEENGRDLGRARKSVLDSGELGQKLGRKIVGGKVLVVMRRERVTLETERTDPHLASDVDLTVKTQLAHQVYYDAPEETGRVHTSKG